MPLSSATEDFLSDVERHSGKRFRERHALGILIDSLPDAPSVEKFETLIFHAKFLTHAKGILAREGVGTEETQKLAQEYASVMEKAFVMLRELAASAPSHERAPLDSVIGMSRGHLERFVALLEELGRVKNYLLDTNAPMPKSVRDRS